MDDRFESTGDRAPVREGRTEPVAESGPGDESASAGDRPADTESRSNGVDGRPCALDDRAMTTCEVTLPDELVADLDKYCRQSHLHREAAVGELLDAWLERTAAES
ncbi:hypothetical protein [Halovivax limisalsi]|uniref:hypothetical protein n=1 Tax=Halovivax limisalsi TaxID=1453760 RepID=UPI001FFDD495|nr:hypothetical protein [Halovivax limisalsi]